MASTISKSVDQLAFNVSLVAYDHGLTSEDFPAGGRLGFREIKRNKKIEHLKDGDYTIPPIKPTHQELSIDQAEFVGIWIGMRPSTANNVAEGGSSSNSFKGKSIQNLALSGGYTVLAKDPKALRVVVPMDKETASYYVLADPDNTGLCWGISVLITEVFFFPQYRNDAQTDVSKRKSEWSERVRKVSNPVEKVSFAKAYDKTKFQVPPKQSLANDLSSFMGTYIEGGDESVLRSAIDLIDRIDTDGSFIPPPHNTALVKLAQSTTNMSGEDCAAALSELLTLAPELKELDITARELRRINKGLANSKAILPYCHLRAFIVQCVHEMRMFEEDDIAHVIVRCVNHVRLQIGGKPTFVERQAGHDGLSLILAGQQQKMQDFLAYARQSITALKDSQGNSVVATAPTLPQIWTKYGVSPDLDTAKAFATAIHRHNVEALATILAIFEKLLKGNCDHLEKLRMSIPPVEPDEDGDENMTAGI
ncbi:hypothetical protein A1O7_07465 [Cladophialophora yegresii CBS 114405]|uniref:Uncharacterized protein n=1 Tax=Cladophialophora yegresii CBS 114405 TaxID=1182544 RepID=W9VY10_9EURO|nr:uncharacterized protein A1O7_07465 [Cladophialophora yegresii CBS 114405]EXJ57121.1 hypothetical protein A1O7_07465 [Cladophialophora yegresii CBS 114405]